MLLRTSTNSSIHLVTASWSDTISVAGLRLPHRRVINSVQRSVTLARNFVLAPSTDTHTTDSAKHVFCADTSVESVSRTSRDVNDASESRIESHLAHATRPDFSVGWPSFIIIHDGIGTNLRSSVRGVSKRGRSVRRAR